MSIIEIKTALFQLWEEYQGLKNFEVLTTIEYLAEETQTKFEEIYKMYVNQDF
jgi:hypothetical protein